ncbi:MAG: tRNA (adenosine(37)-N6)-threonylcarbamoyltransferase complex dimerization subunit type 1 TsaB [Spirochaetaceae bacterium]|nr:tRNA (adenosine(37)-N6)-threonylcarbamoyltransferase complex dimerization subunit type 1 TsaB [Spirochaetaceae bacterium]
MKTILAFDTATPVCSLALGSDKGMWYLEIDAGPRHSESFMGGAAQLMDLAGLGPGDLSGVACMQGPGSFTGLRVGFSAAKGIGLSLGIPLFAVPTLDCLAVSGEGFPGLVAPVLDAKQGRYFTGLFRAGAGLTGVLVMDARDFGALLQTRPEEPVLLTGLDAEKLYTEMEPEVVPRLRLHPGRRAGAARALAALGLRRLAEGGRDDLFSGPVYFRPGASAGPVFSS